MPQTPLPKRWFDLAALPALVLVLGLAATVLASAWLHRTLQQDAQVRFERQVERVADDTLRQFRQPLYGLRGAAGMYAANAQIDRRMFQAYVESRDLPTEFPGVRGLGFIERVLPAGLEPFIARQRRDGAPDFALRQLADKQHPDLFITKFLEPAAQNHGVLGLDVGSEATRREGLERALRSGQPALTAPVVLVQDDQHRLGFLLFVPVFRPGADPVTLAQRKQLLVGLLYAPIVATELLQAVAATSAGSVDFELGDDRPSAAGAVFYRSNRQAERLAGGPPALFNASRSLSLPGRTLALQVHSTPQFEAEIDTRSPRVLALLGVLASLLLATLLRQQASGRQRAEALAQRMTAELTRLAMVAQHTTNAVMIADPQQRITWVNAAFTRLYGHALAQALGRLPGELLGSGKSDAGAVQTLLQATAQGQGCRVQLINRTADGREIWVDTEIAPARDAQGRLIGFIELTQDITEQRQAEQLLAAAMRDNEALLGTIRTQAIVSVADASGTIIDVNEAFCKISGFTRHELLGRNHRIVNSGVQSPAFWVAMWSTIAAGKPWRGQICNRAKDGSLYWVDSIIAPFVGADGRIEKYVSVSSDISDSKRATQELAAERERLARILNGTQAGTWEHDLLTGEDRINAAYAQMLGLSLDECLARLRQSFPELLHPDDRAAMGQALGAHLAGRSSDYEAEFRMQHRDGHWVWVQARGKVAELDDEGRPRSISGIHLDISARKQAEAELQRNHQVLASVLDNLPGGLSVFDADLQLVASNLQFRRLLDLPDSLFAGPLTRFEDIIGYNARRGEYGPGDAQAQVRAIVERARAPAVVHQFERTRPNGLPLEVRGAPMPGGGFVTTYTDISERKRAEAEVDRSARLMRGAIDAIDEAFVLYDPQDRLLYCNHKYRMMYPAVSPMMVAGVSFEQVLRALAYSGGIAAAGCEEAFVVDRLASHRAATGTRVQKLQDGRSLRVIERRMADGHTVGFRVDITEMVRATEAAQAASQAKSQFLANMSHEIRTPMNAILGMLALLRRTPMSARQADYAVKTEVAARSLLGLLNDILDFSKVEAGKLTLEAQPFRLDNLLRDLSAILSATVGDKPLDLLFDIDPALPSALVGDALRLQQVLINLAGNAVKFTQAGEVVVSARLVGRQAGSVSVALAVRDTGIGIAAADQARIFSGFTQAEASTTRRFGGTGLGVAISQRLVALMGGELALDSQPGVGSCFHFTLTLALQETVGDGPASEPPAHPSTDPTSPAPPTRVLVIDDNPTARAILQRMGPALAWTIDQADSGEAGLALLAATPCPPYQAVLVDWQMPGLDGWATSQRIQGLGLASPPPVLVMISAHERERLAQRSALELQSIAGYLVKPLTASMLFDALADARRSQQLPHPSLPAAAPLAARRLAGLRVLVAEDNPNNQQVVRELLEDEGARVQIAPQGLAAVQALQAQPDGFDLVLMDLQMPVMDGFSAAAQIRQGLGLLRLPIIAMTANALASDREACLAAGMNDHVGKPFDLDHLVQVLRQHAGLPALADIAAPGLPALAAALPGAALAAAVDLHGALARLGGKPELYQRMLRSFVEDLDRLPAELREHIDQGDQAAAMRLLHTVKGVAGTLGAARLADAAATGEQALGASHSPAEARAAVAQVSARLEAACPALQALLAELGPAPGTPQPGPQALAEAQAEAPAALRQALQQLARLLQESDMAAVDALARLQQRFGPALGEGSIALDAAVTRLAFEPALQHCQTLIDACPPL